MIPIEQSTSPSEEFYAAEVHAGCTTEKNTGLVYDPRYTISGLYTNVYSVQSENEVLTLLESSLNFN